MIKSFAHKGLERFFLKGSKAGIKAVHADRLRLMLAMLDQARVVEDMDAPGLRRHALKGDLSGYWSVTVQANWRLIFQFDGADAHLVDYLDYH
jgi:proteic killer suppression protein